MNGNHQPDPSFERRVLQGLLAEWHQAVAALDDAYQRVMRPPLLRLTDDSSRWGSWCPDKREIRIHRSVVTDHPWDVARDVLYHEMAHQLADGLDPSSSLRPHGKQFRAACQLLGADPGATGRYPLLHERIRLSRDLADDPVLRRVRKLMALSASGNRHEAALAAAKAQQFIERYNLAVIEERHRQRYHSMFLGKPALRHTRDAYHLANLLTDFYFVAGIWVSTWVMDRRKMGRVLEITGTAGNLDIAGYVHDVIRKFIDRQWQQYNRRRHLSHHRRTDFAVGIIEGVREKIEATRLTDRPRSADNRPVPLEDLELKQHVRRRYRYLRTTWATAATGADSGVHRDGMRAGKRLVIARGIKKKQAAGHPKLLPSS